MPNLLPVLSPITVYFAIRWAASHANGLAALGAMLLSAIVSGLFVAL